MAYDPNNVLGAAPPAEIASYLELIGDYKSARRIREEGGTGQAFSIPYLTVDQWRNRGSKIGYIAEGSGKSAKIIDAVGMDADESLKTARLKLSLDRFYVENYPGMGVHTILCEFTGRNQAAQEIGSHSLRADPSRRRQICSCGNQHADLRRHQCWRRWPRN